MMSENPVGFLKNRVSSDARNKIIICEDLQKDPLLAIKQFVPENMKNHYELAIELNSNPSKAFEKAGVDKETIKKFEAARNIKESPAAALELIGLNEEQKEIIQQAHNDGNDPVVMLQKEGKLSE